MCKTGCLLLILLVLLIPGSILIGVEVATAHSTYRMITARTLTRVLPDPTAPDLFLTVSGTTDEYVLHLLDFPPGTDSSLFEGEMISLLYDTYNNDRYGSKDNPLYDVVAFTLPAGGTPQEIFFDPI